MQLYQDDVNRYNNSYHRVTSSTPAFAATTSSSLLNQTTTPGLDQDFSTINKLQNMRYANEVKNDLKFQKPRKLKGTLMMDKQVREQIMNSNAAQADNQSSFSNKL